MSDHPLSARFVGRVDRMHGWLAFVSDGDSQEIRVSWKHPGAGKGRGGYRCQSHGLQEVPMCACTRFAHDAARKEKNRPREEAQQ